MNTATQQSIIDLRAKILSDTKTTSVTTFIRKHQEDLTALGKALQKWMDESALNYRRSGMSQLEWMDDVTEWMKLQLFHIPEVPDELETVPCFLSTTGIGSSIAFSFQLK